MLLDSKEPVAQLFTSAVDPRLTKLYLSLAEAVTATGCPWLGPRPVASCVLVCVPSAVV